MNYYMNFTVGDSSAFTATSSTSGSDTNYGHVTDSVYNTG